MIYIIITSFNEPKATLKAVNSFLEQGIKENFKIVVSDPFPENEDFIKKNIKSNKLEFFLDTGEGKGYALNLLLKKIYSKNKDDIIVFSDGDVYVSSNSIAEIINSFKNKEIGCVTGRPVTTDLRDKKYGYWSKLLYDGIDHVRKRLSKDEQFLQCSGYLFAIRNGILKEIPLDVPEDCIIPYLIWKEGYKIKYLDKAEVYVKYPDNWQDWIKQRTRTIKAHENISKLYLDMPRTKSLFNELKDGLFFAITYPKNIKEFWWTLELMFARLYIYYLSFKEAKTRKAFDPGWREVEIKSTKPLD